MLRPARRQTAYFCSAWCSSSQPPGRIRHCWCDRVHTSGRAPWPAVSPSEYSPSGMSFGPAVTHLVRPPQIVVRISRIEANFHHILQRFPHRAPSQHRPSHQSLRAVAVESRPRPLPFGTLNLDVGAIIISAKDQLVLQPEGVIRVLEANY